MRVALLRKVFYTEHDIETNRTIMLRDHERVISVLHSEWPHTYTVLIGEEIITPTRDEVSEQLRPTIVTCAVSPPRRWWRR